MIPDNDTLLEVAWQGAAAAGELIQESWQKPKTIEYKGAVDLVTSVDHESEQLLVATIQNIFPITRFLPKRRRLLMVPIGNAAGSLIRWTVRPILRTVIPSSVSP
jgi:fructose-1,6-bisphosphatase/inositol monophosphatase family enzyme